MIHYHGLPIWPNHTALHAINNGHAFLSFARPEQLGIVLEVCSSFAIDNGAFSAWKSGNAITDWREYYEFVAEVSRYPQFDFAVIPDVIDGTEDQNDALIAEFPWQDRTVGAPVFHMHESLGRLERIISGNYRVVCIGSSGEFSTVGDMRWWARMAEIMNVICDKNGRPACKIHGLRMLNPDVFTRLPLSSADSTAIARAVAIDSKWTGSYAPANKDVRALIIRDRIESRQGATFWEKQTVQSTLF